MSSIAAARAGARAHGAAEFAQEQDLRRLERLVGVLPHPRPFRVGAAEGGLHGGSQRAAVERAALAEQLREQGRGMEKPRDLVGGGWGRNSGSVAAAGWRRMRT